MITEQRRAEIREAALTAGPAGLAAITDLMIENHELRQGLSLAVSTLEATVALPGHADITEDMVERGKAAMLERFDLSEEESAESIAEADALAVLVAALGGVR